MQLRSLASCFFLIYGASIPILCTRFVEDHPVVSLALIGSCILIAAMLWVGRPVLINLLIALYVFKIYLTKPYTTVFLDNLEAHQLTYLASIQTYFFPDDAVVVYLSLFTLLLAWVLGLIVVKPRRIQNDPKPFWLFQRIDLIVMRAQWPFWATWALFVVLTHQSASQNWQGIASDFSSGTASPLFAYGLLSLDAINIVCLYTFISSLQTGRVKASFLLLLPVIYAATTGVLGGGRGAIFSIFLIALSYWLFLYYGIRVRSRQLLRLTALMAILLPGMVFGGIFAQELRSVLRSGADQETVDQEILKNLDWNRPNNPVVKNLQYNITRLLYRLSSLEQPFLILNDRFQNHPWDHYNPWTTTMRIVNDLVPGDVFPGVPTINQLFAYIYFNTFVPYRSDMWSIQGTLYLYFGFGFSALVVFLLACVVTHNALKLELLFRASPSICAVFIVFFSDLLENGTLERVIVVDVVRPMASFFAIVMLVALIREFTRVKMQRVSLPVHPEA
jgi:hypothetical protein